VRRRQSVHHLGENLHGVLDRQPAGFGEPLPERLARHEGHAVVVEPVGLAGIEQRQDVRVLQLRGDFDLAEEPVAAQGGGDFRTQHLDRHLAAVLHVLGQVDRGHAARADFPLDAVAVGEGGGETSHNV
jgi:hypothetical protein